MGNPFGVEQRLMLKSPLALEACRERLRAETGSIWNPFSGWTHPVRGRVTDQGFWLLRSIRYRNSFQIEARGRWATEGPGTRIDVALATDRTARWAMGLWLALVGVFGLVWLLVPHHPAEPGMPTWVANLLPVFMLAIGILAIATGRWLARNDASFLIDFLRRTLECAPEADAIS